MRCPADHHRPPRFLQSRPLGALILTLALLLAGFGASLSGAPAVRADETTESASADEQIAAETAPSETETDSQTEAETELPPSAAPPTEPEEPATGGEDQASEPPVDAPSEPVVEPEAPAQPATQEQEEQAEPSPAPSEEPSPSPAPALIYDPNDQPICLPAEARPDIVAHGAFLDYDCAYDVHLAAENVAPSAIQLDWTVQSAVNGGWRVQIRPPIVDPNPIPAWTPAESASARFEHRSAVADDAATEPLAHFDATTTLTFGLRVHRVACGAVAEPVQLDLTVRASLPGLAASSVEERGGQPATFVLNPGLAPIPEPALAFSGALDFGDVPVDAMGVQAAPAPQAITVTVSGLDQACGAWSLGLNANALGGADGSTIAASTLQLVSVNDDALAAGDCALDDGCAIAVVPAGPDAAPTATFSLGVSLVLPDQLRATTFNSTLTATLAAAHSETNVET